MHRLAPLLLLIRPHYSYHISVSHKQINSQSHRNRQHTPPPTTNTHTETLSSGSMGELAVVASSSAAAATPSTPMASASASPPPDLLERLKDYKQEHVLSFWEDLSPRERDLLVAEIEGIDLPRIDRIIRCSLDYHGLPVAAIELVPETMVSTVDERTVQMRERWWNAGLNAIRRGKLAVLL
ncbi:UDP-N-acetylglucosamine diphosphorylase 2-like protein [Drosera capensis]